MLGLQLDSELRWKSQVQAIDAKMKTQVFALARTTASTWGITLRMARQVYLTIVRSALSYGASLWHTPSESPTSRPRGPVVGLRAHQNSCLRTVLGAFKATPIRQLETEAYIPPFDLWLNGRVAYFQARLELTGIGQQIKDACTIIKLRIRARRQRQRRRTAG